MASLVPCDVSSCHRISSQFPCDMSPGHRMSSQCLYDVSSCHRMASQFMYDVSPGHRMASHTSESVRLAPALLLLLLGCCVSPSLGWGRVANRFSPEVLASFGYSGGNRHYYSPNAMPQTSALVSRSARRRRLRHAVQQYWSHVRPDSYFVAGTPNVTRIENEVTFFI